jgi:hypothetical protein
VRGRFIAGAALAGGAAATCVTAALAEASGVGEAAEPVKTAKHADGISAAGALDESMASG